MFLIFDGYLTFPSIYLNYFMKLSSFCQVTAKCFLLKYIKMEVIAIYGIYLVHRLVLCTLIHVQNMQNCTSFIWRKGLSNMIFEERKKYDLIETSANALLFFLLNLIKYAYSLFQAELFICMYLTWNVWLYKVRGSLKVTSEKEINSSATVIRISLNHKRDEIAPFSSTTWGFDLLIILTLNFFPPTFSPFP